jgi:hypothetical protein
MLKGSQVETPMVDWFAVFDEAYPVRGATVGDIKRLVESVTRPVSPVEVEEINRSQQNPFPKGDPLYASWRPFDPSQWLIPNRHLLPSYLAFLRWSNGGEFRTGERWFQFFAANEVRGMLLAYHVPQYMSGAIPFGFNGSGTFYMFDMRRPPRKHEYPIVCVHSTSLGWEPGQWVRVAGSFEAACRGAKNVDDLLYPIPDQER